VASDRDSTAASADSQMACVVSAFSADGPIGLREMKRNAARAALDFVDADAVIGIGSGTTVWCFIDLLAESGIPIAGAVPASLECARRLREIGVGVLELSDRRPTLYVDGADQVDMSGRAIKGGGAAHTHEKAIATASDYWACIVDATKIVRELGGVPVPIEVADGAAVEVLSAVERLGGEGRLRESVLTDTGHQVIDALGLPLGDPLELEVSLDAVPGVIGNGVFARRTADVVLVGRATGGVARIVPHESGEPTD
jgi:ribose 5-phosphate isomerase A